MNEKEVSAAARAIWAVMAPMTENYSEVTFDHIMLRPRYQHLRERLHTAAKTVIKTIDDVRAHP